MKKLLLILICIVYINNAHAIFKFGIRGGVSSTSANFDFDEAIELGNSAKYYIQTGEAKIGYHIGAMTQISLLSFYAQPEFLFSSVRNDYRVQTVESNQTTGFKNVTETINRFDIPIVMGVKLGPLRIGAGPVASKILSSTSEIKDFIFEDRTANEKIKDFTWGYQLGLGFDLMNVAFDIKYEGSLGNIGNSINYDNSNYNFDSRPKQLIFSIGYYFVDL